MDYPIKALMGTFAAYSLVQRMPTDCICLLPDLTLFKMKVSTPTFDVSEREIEIDLSYGDMGATILSHV